MCYNIVAKEKYFHCDYIFIKRGDIMKIITFGRGVEVTNDLKELFDKKIAKLDKFFRDDAQCNITLRERKNGRKKLEVTITSKGTIYRSENEDETFQNALDRATEKIERQIRKNKTRLLKRLREDAFLKTSNSVNDKDVEEEHDFDIRVKSFSFKPMSVEEAILQMNLLEHEFFVFENDETHKINVVYRRHSDKYGLITQE